MKSFENFLSRGINQLKLEPLYFKTMVFTEVYKFNSELELGFIYEKINLRKGAFKHTIEDGKMLKPKKVYGESDLDKVVMYLDAWDSNYKFKTITEDKFKDELQSVMNRYVHFLAAPKVIRKNEYSEKNL